MTAAILAAKSAGAFLKKHFYDQKKVDEASQNDIKLELDKLSQKLITEEILSVFPTHAVLGEEGYTGDRNSEYEWIVDPIDGTVNYFYTIPWFCVSIALRRRGEIVLGVIYDPMMDECWHVEKGGIPYMNDHPCIAAAGKRWRRPWCSWATARRTVPSERESNASQKSPGRYARCATTVPRPWLWRILPAAGLTPMWKSVISIWGHRRRGSAGGSRGGKVVLEPKEGNPEQFAIVAWNGRIPIMEALDE